jgi:hypothetical protein
MFFSQKKIFRRVNLMEQQQFSWIGRALLCNTLFAAVLVAGTGFLATPASATPACSGTATITCTDITKVKAYNGNYFQNTYTANGFTAGIGDVLQSSTHSFNTDKLIANLTEHRGTVTLELKYYTAFNGNDLGAHYADIFMGSASTPNSFGYAIALGNQQINTSGFYYATPSTEETSRQIWSSKIGTYGGQHQGMNSDGTVSTSWYDSPTVVASNATKKSGFTTSVVESTTSADPGYGYLVDVKLSGSATDFNTLFGGGLSIFWGTADCSNDAIQAVFAYAPVHIPEPMTLALFSAGVIGGGALRRRRKH